MPENMANIAWFCYRKRNLAFAIAFLWLLFAVSVPVYAGDLAQSVKVDLPAEPLESALGALAHQADIQILFSPNLVSGISSPAVSGEMSATDALNRLLKSTALEFKIEAKDTVTVRARSAQPRPIKSDPTASDATATEGIALSEIIVTAQKREERLQDVPVPVTAVTAETLTGNNQLRLQDYQALLPSLNVELNDYGAPELAIRGLTTGTYANPSVGTVIDDVPFGASSALVFGDQPPDLDPSDLARVEELRGPQGTLYGASSLGGLLKYVTVDPSTQAFSGRVEAGLSGVENGNQPGYEARGAVNMPLTDTLAVRASAFSRLDPGYIDDPTLHATGVNKGEQSGGRLSGLWRPSEDYSLKLSAMFQKLHIDGSSLADVGPGFGDLQQNDVRGTGWFDRQMQFYSAVFKAKLWGADLTAISGYGINQWSDALDYTAAFGFYSQHGVPAVPGSPNSGFAGFGVPGTVYTNDIRTKKFSQEVRVLMPIGERLEWLAGAFFTDEKSHIGANQYAADSDSGTPVGTWYTINGSFKYTEYAAFTNLTYHFTDQFDVQLGARESRNDQIANQTWAGVYVTSFLLQPSSPYTYPAARADGSSFTYLVTPQFKFSNDLMLYARIASGYRPGGPNILPAGSAVATTYKPDTTHNYEIGLKGSTADHKFSFDASVYYIDWKGIQLAFITPAAYFTANGSAAKSQGVELSLEYRPLRDLKIAGWISWDDAALTKALPVEVAPASAGDWLPSTPHLSSNLSLDEEFPLTSRWKGFAGATVNYVGHRQGLFVYESSERQDFSPYAQLNLRAGVQFDAWTYGLFVNNALDKRGELDGGLGTLNPTAFHYIQPRTVGLSVIKSF